MKIVCPEYELCTYLYKSSEIASLLLDNGCTAHSIFHIPLQVHDTSVCSITPHSNAFPLLQQTSNIIWDEVPIQHNYAIKAVDQTTQNLLGNNSPFSGITVWCGGDFYQTLPVIPHADEAHFGIRLRW